jgi:hypothetical protein
MAFPFVAPREMASRDKEGRPTGAGERAWPLWPFRAWPLLGRSWDFGPRDFGEGGEGLGRRR